MVEVEDDMRTVVNFNVVTAWCGDCQSRLVYFSEHVRCAVGWLSGVSVVITLSKIRRQRNMAGMIDATIRGDPRAIQPTKAGQNDLVIFPLLSPMQANSRANSRPPRDRAGSATSLWLRGDPARDGCPRRRRPTKAERDRRAGARLIVS